MGFAVFRFEHNSHGWRIVEWCGDLDQEEELGLRSDGHRAAAVLVFVEQSLSSLFLHPQMLTIIHQDAEVLQRRLAQVAEEDGDSALRIHVLMLNTDLKQRIFEQDSGCRRAQIRKRLSHGWDDVFRNSDFWLVQSVCSRTSIADWTDRIVDRILLGCLLRRNFFGSPGCSGTLGRALPLCFAGSCGLRNSCAVISLLFTQPLLQRALLLVLEWWHFTQQVLHRFSVECFSHGSVLGGTLLNFHVHRILAAGKDRRNEGTALLVKIGQLGVRAHQNGPRLRTGCGPVLMQNAELLFSAHAWSFCHQETELPKHVRCDPDRSLVATSWTGGHQQRRSRVRLQVALRVVGHNLHDTVPDGIAHVIAADGDEFEDGVNVPAQVGCILFRQNGNLQHHLFPNGSIRQHQMGNKLIDDALRVIGIAHDEEEVKGTAPDGYIGILQGYQHGLLMLLDRFVASLQLRELCHRHEAEVSDVGFSDGNELSKQLHGALPQLGWSG
mmetsp:Transcript_13358/g.38463  ORF Transcript_13358/g.38463 Transcript_13358/m.38463 type:complete len:496 (+) Transcript_13358:501-1988(+)